MDALTPDCYMLPGTLVWRCELKESEHKAAFQFFSKVISHSNSARTSTHKTDSLSIGYRLWLIRVQNEIPTRWYICNKKISKLGEDDSILQTDTGVNADSKIKSENIVLMCLTKLCSLNILNYSTITCCCCLYAECIVHSNRRLWISVMLLRLDWTETDWR